MVDRIQIIEKPDWISWNDIKQCLWDSHSVNRERGINMAHYQWPAEQIKDSLGPEGIMFVALDGNKVVGTAALGDKKGYSWYLNGKYAYMCFASVLPSYKGLGIYKTLTEYREEYARLHNINTLLLDTHQSNKRIQNIALKNGYRYVRFFRAKSGDHFSVVMVKWLNGCPYSSFYCWVRYYQSKLKTLLRSFLKK